MGGGTSSGSRNQLATTVSAFTEKTEQGIQNHPDEWEKALTRWQRKRLSVIRTLYAQQREMYESGSNRIDNRIVSLSQLWVRPIVRGKQNAPVEFGAKVAMSDIDGFLRIELLSWDAFNECHTLQDSVEANRKAYGDIRSACWRIPSTERRTTSGTARNTASISTVRG